MKISIVNCPWTIRHETQKKKKMVSKRQEKRGKEEREIWNSIKWFKLPSFARVPPTLLFVCNSVLFISHAQVICERKSQIQLYVSNAKQYTFAKRIMASNGQTIEQCIVRIGFWQFAWTRATSTNRVWKEYFGFNKQFIFMSYTRAPTQWIEHLVPYREALFSFAFHFRSSFVSQAKGDSSFRHWWKAIS